MAQKMTGALVFDERTDRYDIRFDLNSYCASSVENLLRQVHLLHMVVSEN